jgi:Ran GTPase-activating protein (RanGAP) involved in mRNA processing and transport
MLKSSDIKAKLFLAYQDACQKTKTKANKSLNRYLSDPEGDNPGISIIFRGNHKLNFTSRLNDQDVILLCNILEPFASSLLHLDLSYNLITDNGAVSIGKLIAQTKLLSLNLQGNAIEIDGAKAIADSIKENISLEYINLNYNNIQTDGILQIIHVLFVNKNLRALHIADNKINHDGISGIMSVLGWHNSTLEVLELDNAHYDSIGQEIAIHVAKMLQSNQGLEKLALRKHAINSEGLYIMTEHLLDNNKLKILDLSCNKINHKGCESIGKFLLGDNCVLESLNLANNRTGHYGAKYMAMALAKNRTLIHLDMTTNDIDDDGLRMIGESLFENSQLVSLKLYNNHFDQSSLKVFHELVYNHKKDEEFATLYYFDFDTYWVDGRLQMCFVENVIPYDVKVSKPYYVDEFSNV